MQSAKSADDYFANTNVWKNEQLRLRAILLTTPLSEEIKNRIHKVLPMITAGVGLNDKYRR